MVFLHSGIISSGLGLAFCGGRIPFLNQNVREEKGEPRRSRTASTVMSVVAHSTARISVASAQDGAKVTDEVNA